MTHLQDLIERLESAAKKLEEERYEVARDTSASMEQRVLLRGQYAGMKTAIGYALEAASQEREGVAAEETWPKRFIYKVPAGSESEPFVVEHGLDCHVTVSVYDLVGNPCFEASVTQLDRNRVQVQGGYFSLSDACWVATPISQVVVVES